LSLLCPSLLSPSLPFYPFLLLTTALGHAETKIYKRLLSFRNNRKASLHTNPILMTGEVTGSTKLLWGNMGSVAKKKYFLFGGMKHKFFMGNTGSVEKKAIFFEDFYHQDLPKGGILSPRRVFFA
jgi:hypothetical protein